MWLNCDRIGVLQTNFRQLQEELRPVVAEPDLC